MTLGELITALEAADPNQVVSHGFHNPHSYRGDYYDLAFEPAQNVTVASMLEAARTALGTTYQGWKGGDFTMDADTWCWLSEQGTASCDNISSLLFTLMLSQPADEAAAPADRATVYREVADRLAADAEQGEKEGFTRIYRRSAAKQVRDWADEAQQPETPCCSDPTCACVQVNAAGRCDCAKWDNAPAGHYADCPAAVSQPDEEA
jgi:hypothetical protein